MRPVPTSSYIVGVIIAYLVIVIALIGGLVGYVMNIWKFLTAISAGSEMVAVDIFRGIGLLVYPLGAILGYF